MTYEAEEIGVETGRPVELYHFYFEYGAANYYFTSADHSITYGGHGYSVENISRTELKQKAGGLPANIDIMLPIDNVVAALFIDIPPFDIVYVTIYHHHLDDSSVEEIWSGSLSGARVSKSGTMVTLRGSAESAAKGHQIPRDVYSGICPFVLYGTECGVDDTDSDFYHTDECTGQGDTYVTVTDTYSDPDRPDGWAIGGYVKFGNEKRLIVDQDEDILYINIPFIDDMVGEDLTVYAGCDHTLDDCGDKFSNSAQFGGFPTIPSRNPFTIGLE